MQRAFQLLCLQQCTFVFTRLEVEVVQVLLHTCMMEPLPVLSTPEAILAAMRAAAHPGQTTYRAFYSSRLRGVVTDPALMVVPIDDRLVHRGHSVFDTLLVVGGKTYLLQQHINRFVRSAKAARIDLPMPPEELKATLKQLVATVGLRTCKLRYWLSAGPGSLLITPVKGMSVFYALLYEEAEPRQSQPMIQGIHEFTVSIPLKPQCLATMKTTNYMLNALTAMEAEEKGGHYGIQKDSDSFVQECSVANLSFVLPGNRFVTPPFDSILTGTVLSRLLLMAHKLVEQGFLAAVEQRPIHIDEAKTAVELIQSGGDHISPIIQWDGVVVGEGAPGPVYLKLQDMLLDDIYGNDPDVNEQVQYQ